jgi:hypothetical protein
MRIDAAVRSISPARWVLASQRSASNLVSNVRSIVFPAAHASAV